MSERKSAGTGKAKIKNPTRKVPFEFNAPEAREVYLAGGFNSWNINANPLKKDRKGSWKTSLSLEPGRYEYRFLVDGNWVNDCSCAGCVPNGFGSENCVKIIE